jgi:hypothetical protein
VQVARALSIEVRDVRIRVEARFHRTGSVIRGDADTVCDGVRTSLSFASDQTDERNTQLARMAEASCYTIGALRRPVECVLDVTVNGRTFALD